MAQTPATVTMTDILANRTPALESERPLPASPLVFHRPITFVAAAAEK